LGLYVAIPIVDILVLLYNIIIVLDPRANQHGNMPEMVMILCASSRNCGFRICLILCNLSATTVCIKNIKHVAIVLDPRANQLGNMPEMVMILCASSRNCGFDLSYIV
jgi:hypothetical protein